MTFSPPFQRVFPASFDRRAAAVTPWYLTGGIAAANCIAAYQPKGAASLAASYTNLANPGTYNAELGVAPGWDATNGWSGDGASAYLKTGIVPVSTWSTIVRFTGFTNNSFLFGIYGSPYYGYEKSGGTNYYENYAFVGTTPPVGDSGVIAICNRACYVNGLLDKTLGAASGSITNDFYLLAGNTSTVGINPLYYTSAKIQAFAIYNITLTAVNIAALTTAINAL